MRTTGLLVGVLAITFGILVIVLPELLRWLVGVFLIIGGVIALIRR